MDRLQVDGVVTIKTARNSHWLYKPKYTCVRDKDFILENIIHEKYNTGNRST